jgi:hypothetical protein
LGSSATAPAQPSAPQFEAQADHPIDRTPSRLAFTDDGACLITSSGGLRCRMMVLGSSAGISQDRPPTGTFREIVATQFGFCALRDSGAVDCWRSPSHGLSTIAVFRGSYTQIAASRSGVCALDRAGDVHCVGVESWPDEEHATSEARRTDMRGAKSLVGSGTGICALSESRAMCIFEHTAHRSKRYPDARPFGDMHFEIAGDFVSVTQNKDAMCALQRDGRVVCRKWVINRPPERPDDPGRTFPGDNFVALTSTPFAICAQRTDRSWTCPSSAVKEPGRADLYFASENLRDEAVGIALREGGRLEMNLPGATPPSRGGFVEVSTHSNRLCARRADDTLYCNGRGTISYDDDWMTDVRSVETVLRRNSNIDTVKTDKGTMTSTGVGPSLDALAYEKLGAVRPLRDRQKEAQAEQPGRSLEQIQYGNSFGCGIDARKRVHCWGKIQGSRRKARPPEGRFESLALGGVSAVALAEDGTLQSWGTDYFGTVSDTPEGHFTGLRTSYLNACAQDEDGRPTCWGAMFDGAFQLPFVPASYALTHAGVCAISAPGQDLECFGSGFVWTDPE